MKQKKSKVILIAITILFIFFISADFNSINIEKTALIVSLGVDKSEKGYSVTAQVAIPQGDAKSSSQNSESIIVGEGETIYKAVSQIGEQTGWYPKMSFCNLVVLGESILSENIMSVVDFFVRSYKIEDSSIICSCEGSAKDLLKSVSPLDNVSGFALTKIFVRDFDTASRIMTSTIKNFTIAHFSRSNYGFMPYVKIVKTDDEVVSSDSGLSGTSGESGAGDGQGTSSQGGSQNKPVVYDATTTVLLSGGNMVGKLDSEDTLFFSLLYKRVNEASFTITSHDNEGREGKFLISITKATHNLGIEFIDDIPYFSTNLDVWLKVTDVSFPQSISELSSLGKLNNETLYKATVYIEERLKTLFEKVQEQGCDLFQATNLLYKHYPKKYEKHYLTIKEQIKPKIKVKCFNAS